MQSTLDHKLSCHVAIIMDGNGRWAQRRGLPRTAGHRAGMEALRRIVEAAPALDISTLSLFAFSADNWRRPGEEVRALMALFYGYLRSETAQLAKNSVRVSFIGRRDRLARGLQRAMENAERSSEAGANLHVRIAIDYSSREAIARAAARCELDWPSAADDCRRRLAHSLADRGSAGDVDLLIRTGGEKRLSDFLLWESAYAELWFTDIMWPDFDAAALRAAMADFRRRERRFGALGASLSALTENLDRNGDEHGNDDSIIVG